MASSVATIADADAGDDARADGEPGAPGGQGGQLQERAVLVQQQRPAMAECHGTVNPLVERPRDAGILRIEDQFDHRMVEGMQPDSVGLARGVVDDDQGIHLGRDAADAQRQIGAWMMGDHHRAHARGRFATARGRRARRRGRRRRRCGGRWMAHECSRRCCPRARRPRYCGLTLDLAGGFKDFRPRRPPSSRAARCSRRPLLPGRCPQQCGSFAGAGTPPGGGGTPRARPAAYSRRCSAAASSHSSNRSPISASSAWSMARRYASKLG